MPAQTACARFPRRSLGRQTECLSEDATCGHQATASIHPANLELAEHCASRGLRSLCVQRKAPWGGKNGPGGQLKLKTHLVFTSEASE